MSYNSSVFSDVIQSIATVIETNAEEITALDQAIGDGDHVTNLQRGIKALLEQKDEISQLNWSDAFKKIGMIVMSTIGGASGSLYGTFFIALSKAFNEQNFTGAFKQAVEAVKHRGKADKGEKTMLDVLIPVSEYLQESTEKNTSLPELLEEIKYVATKGMESTRDMIATKGRASYLGERSKGHIDAGAKTSQLMICTIADVLTKHSASPA